MSLVSFLSGQQLLGLMLDQHLLEIPARMTGGMFCHLLRSATRHDLAPLVAPFWTEIHDPVSTADHIEVVLNHQDRVALVYQALHHIHQLVHIKKAQAGGGLVDQVEGLTGGPLGELGGQLDPLGLTAGEGRCRLAQLHVAQAHINQGAQPIGRLGNS